MTMTMLMVMIIAAITMTIIHHFTDNPNIQNQAVSGKPLPPLKRTD